jgi:DNA-binding CsgD family transcriptional regulator
MKSVVNAFKALSELPVSSVIIDASGMIVAVNDTWKEFGRRNGLSIPNAGVGANYLQYCAESEFTMELKSLLAGRLGLLTLVYPCHSPDEKRWFSLIGVPLSPAEPAGVALLHVNLTGMLPPQIGASLTQVEATSRGHARPTINVDTISGAIERSVSEALSSQLSTMFRGARQDSAHEKTLARREADQILGRTRLSERQMQVLRLLGEGKTNKEIAEALFRSPNTIKLHVSAILQRLKLKRRTQAALLASRLFKEGSTDLKSWKNTPAQHKTHRSSRQ